MARRRKNNNRKDAWRIKKYVCKVKLLPIRAGKNIIVLNEEEAKEHDVYYGFTEMLRFKKKEIYAIVDVADSPFIKPGECGVFEDVAEQLGVKDGDLIEIVHLNRPKSLDYVRKKIDGHELGREEIMEIIQDVMLGKIGSEMISAFITAMHINGLSDNEVVYLTDAIVESGEKLELKKKFVVDKHSIGGVAGNRITMIVVPIIASFKDLYIPKSSSRSITSAAGTADTMEVLANVDIPIEELKKQVLKINGAIVWGGGLNIASADDLMIKIRRPLALDPRGVLLASILAKKKAVSSKYIVIDIPVGRDTKMKDVGEANDLAAYFIKIGKRLGMDIDVLITDGKQPIGNGVGPGLECRDVLDVLAGRGPEDLRHKSLLFAGRLLEMVGKAKEGEGYFLAERVLNSGRALKKMREIIEWQGGDPRVKKEDLPLGRYKYEVKAKRNGKIAFISNKGINKIARIAGSPIDKGAGIFLYKKVGDRVRNGETIFEIYTESETKLSYAIKALEDVKPIEFERMLLEKIVDI